ncbi:MAG TPA: hypothetical protein VHJ82_06620 [Actinomycetota bacterium]|nr:hypothetical protein [Actinomycetota bacterium]
MKKVALGLLVAAVLVLAGGQLWLATRSDESGFPRPRRTRAPVLERRAPALRPATLRVENVALGKSRVRVAQAITALKEIGLWRRLTRHLYIVRVGSRPGVTDVPDDRHLADAYLWGQIDEKGAGGVCDIMLYPRAIKDDLERAALFHAQGLADVPPSLEHFWAAVVAHELAHCLPHRNESGFPRLAPEPTAEKWEQRALARLQV